MSIINTFDPCGKELIRAQDAIRPIENFPNTMIVVFSEKFRSLLLKKYEATEIGALHGGGTSHPIYQFEYKGVMMGFFTSTLGGPAAAAFLEELIALGAKNFLYFGSCGALDREIAEGRLLVPTAAYRDEGVSYHYAEASDFLEIQSAPALAKVFDEMGVAYNATKTWTTDSFYRETDRNMQLRKSEGCGVVEMECASVMAVGQFRKKNVYQFLYAADCLDESTWDKRTLGNMPQDLRERILVVAIEAVYRLQNQK